MNKARAALSFLLVFILMFPSLGSVAYANPDDDSTPVDQSEGYETETNTEDSMTPPDTETPPDTLESESPPDTLEPETPLDTLDSDFFTVDAADYIEYIYLDKKVIALDEEGYIAFGLIDSQAVISSAELVLKKIDTEEMLYFKSNSVFENSALISFTFTEQLDAAAYAIESLRYKVETSGTTFEALISNENANGEDYSFEVVSKELKDALSGDAADGDISVLAIAGDELVASDTVEDALEVVEEASSVDEVQNDALDAQSIQSLSTDVTPAAATSAREDYLIVALDPGHGGPDPGAVSYVQEASANWHIAAAMKAELETYTGVSAYLTRGQNENPSLQQRVNNAVAVGADVFISLHNNSGGGTGSEIWVPNSSSYLKDGTHAVGSQLATKILEQLTALGLTNRGVKTRDYGDLTYSDGSVADYYGVIRASREAGIPGIIVEHAFVDNANDASKLASPAFLTQLGVADATGVARYYNLQKSTTAKSIATIQYQAHLSTLGWQSTVYDSKVAGTSKGGFSIEALNVQLVNKPAGISGDIEIQANVMGTGWQGWRSGGTSVGTTGQGKSIQALQIRLTDQMANNFDVYYRTKVVGYGWLEWAKNGASSGTDLSRAITGVQIIRVAKNASAPGATGLTFIGSTTSVLQYRAHSAFIGWQSPAIANTSSFAGTTGLSSNLEALTMAFSSPEYSGSIEYNSHLAYVGWQGWKTDGALSGTSGQNRPMEAVVIRLTGEMASHYDIYYRAHVQNFGWLDWASNGAPAGTAGYSYRMEALQVKLVAKGSPAPGNTASPYRQIGSSSLPTDPLQPINPVQPTGTVLSYQTHVAYLGWQSSVSEGNIAGTTGQSKAIEALKVNLSSTDYSGSVEYNSHLYNVGWQGWKASGAMSGTTGQNRQMEALRIRLTGELANQYDIYYRVHAKNFGWLGWACNGGSAGTAGFGYRMEALQIKLVAKDAPAPGSTTNPFREQVVTASPSAIMGAPQTTVAQMVAYYNNSGKIYPSSVYSLYGASNISAWCALLLEEANREGVRAEVVMCQAMKETGWLQFGGQVQVGQCNFAGLGATNGGAAGADFRSYGNDAVRVGLRAQVQHLKGYATTMPTSSFASPIVSPRFPVLEQLGYRGIAPTLEGLNGRWAVPGTTYGQEILLMINTLSAFPK